MLTKNTTENIDNYDFVIAGFAKRLDLGVRKPFVSCFRVVKGFENRKNYKVEPLPKEYHALFQEKV